MQSRQKKKNLDLIPVILMMALLPLAAKGEKVNVTLGKYAWFPDGDFQYDFFIYWKGICFLILAAWMLIVLVDRTVIRRIKIKKNKKLLLLLLYGGFVLLSTLVSVDKSLSLKGMWQQYESVWVLLAYPLTAFYGMQVTESEKDIRVLLRCMAIGAAVQGILGLTQLFGMDFHASDIGKNLLTAGFDSSVKEAMRYVYEGNSRSSVYMASYTPNYAAMYLLILLPVIAAMFFYTEKKNEKAAYAIIFAILILCLYGSGSRTGIFTTVCLLAASLALLKPGKKWLLPAGAGIIVLAGVLGYIFQGKMDILQSWKQITEKQQYDLQSIQTENDGILLDYKGNRLKILPEMTDAGETLRAVENETETQMAKWDLEKDCFRFPETGYEDLEFDAYMQDDTQYLTMKYLDITWNFYKTAGAEKYVYLNQYGKEDQLQSASAVWKGYERGLSGRIYIWGRTIPLLKEHILLGSGPDTFAAVFPQSDYVMRANTSLGMYQQIPTKAHNMYLQTALQSGFLSLVCLLIFWVWNLADSLKKLRSKKTKERWLYLGIFLAVLGFFVMGCTNDSNLAVSPLFWCLLGIQMADSAS